MRFHDRRAAADDPRHRTEHAESGENRADQSDDERLDQEALRIHRLFGHRDEGDAHRGVEVEERDEPGAERCGQRMKTEMNADEELDGQKNHIGKRRPNAGLSADHHGHEVPVALQRIDDDSEQEFDQSHLYLLCLRYVRLSEPTVNCKFTKEK